MSDRAQTPYFSFDTSKVSKKSISERLWEDTPFSRRVAKPLFDAGLTIGAITERTDYDSGSPPSFRPYHVFMVVLEGEIEIQIKETITIARPGDLLCAPAGSRFRRTVSGTACWLYLDFEDCEYWAELKKLRTYVRQYEHAGLAFHLVRSILNAQNSGGGAAAALAQDSSRLLLSLLRYEIALSSKGVSRRSVALQKLMGEIARSPEEDWNLADMAKQLSVSPSHLATLFRREYGVSPINAVIKQRMHKATKELLNPSLSIQQIAARVGYESVCSFTRLFKKHMGMPPGEFRKRAWSGDIPQIS